METSVANEIRVKFLEIRIMTFCLKACITCIKLTKGYKKRSIMNTFENIFKDVQEIKIPPYRLLETLETLLFFLRM